MTTLTIPAPPTAATPTGPGRWAVVGQLARYSGVGAVSTVVSLALYAGLRTAIDAQTANVISTALLGVGNAVANRKLTFAGDRAGSPWRHLTSSLLLLAFGLALGAVALAGLDYAVPGASRVAELGAVVAASLVGGLLRFLVLRGRTGRAHRPRSGERPKMSEGPSTVFWTTTEDTGGTREHRTGRSARVPAPSSGLAPAHRTRSYRCPGRVPADGQPAVHRRSHQARELGRAGLGG